MNSPERFGGVSRTVRAAAAQCEIGTNVSDNIATLVRMVGAAAQEGAELVVLPEFGNHMSVYDSAEQAWRVAIDAQPGDAFVDALIMASADHDIWVVANSTVRRAAATATSPACITITQLLFSPTDGLKAQVDKQVLMGAERTYLVGGDEPARVIDTPLGRLGLYCCMDGVISEPARDLAVQGAEIMCNSLNSFALDEASLHVPSRAVENHVWVVACCKVGPLLPEHRRAEFASFVDLPESTFTGAGESQVVSPDGTVVVQAPRVGEAVVVADIDLGAAAMALRPDGTDVLDLRRPELYAPIAEAIAPLPASGAATLDAVAVQTGCGDIKVMADLVGSLARDGAQLIVLPELAAVLSGEIPPGGESTAAQLSAELVDALVAVLADTEAHVALSIIEAVHGESDAAAFHHVGVVLSARGVESHQPALHRPQRHRHWQSALGDRQKVLATPFGRLSVLVGDDALVPEAARLAVLGGAEVIAAPMTIATTTDLSLVLPQRSAENRVCLVAATRPTPDLASAAFDPPADPIWSLPVRLEPFDGAINDPDRHVAAPGDGVLRVTLHPSRAAEKLISTDTDLVYGRRPELRAGIVSIATVTD